MTVGPNGQPVADPTTAAGAATDAGQTQAPDPAQQQQQTQQQQQQQQQNQPPAGDNAEPLFVAKNQDELNNKFGATREEGRLSVAKKYGFDTVEAFDTAATAWKNAHDGTLTEAQRAQEAQKTAERERDALRLTVATQKMADTQKTLATKLGIDQTKLDRVERYRDKNPAEINPDGTVNESLVEHSLTMFLTQNQEFKAPPVTVGAGGNPAGAAGEPNSLDARIAEATNKGDINTAISLELQKMFQAN